MNYLTMICDIKDSRNLNNRNEIQTTLINTLEQCNNKFNDMIISPFIITLGDEWQGLLAENSDFYNIIEFFHKSLPSNINFYTGIGIGNVTIYNFDLTVNKLDGPSFYLAREALYYAKRNNHSIVILND